VSDTPTPIEELWTLLLARSPVERVRMSSRMFATAKTLAAAELRAANPTVSARDLRYGLLCRLYGDELSERDRAAIADSSNAITN
jgi:hypothetical protein